MKLSGNLSPTTKLKILRKAYIDHVYDAAGLAGIKAPSRRLFIRDTASPTFRNWNGIKISASQGRAECDPYWLDPALGFERFAAQMGPRPYSDGLKRLDDTKPWSIWNATWVPKIAYEIVGTPTKATREIRGKFATEEAERLEIDPRMFRRKMDNWLYRTWSQIYDRCNDPSAPAYASYGGRGIGVFEDWDSHTLDFELFTSWVLGNLGDRPEGCTLDRIDNDGNYAPGNLRWATAGEQMANTRTAQRVRQRSAVVDFMVEAGASAAEIATAVQCSPSTAKRLVAEAHRQALPGRRPPTGLQAPLGALGAAADHAVG